MIGSPAIGAVLALWGFWALIAVAWARTGLGPWGVLVFVLLWIVGYVGLRTVLYGSLFTPYVAVLDIALVFVVFKGDVRLS